MHLVTFAEDIPGKQPLQGDEPYLFEDIGAGGVLTSPVTFIANNGDRRNIGLSARVNSFALSPDKRLNHKRNYNGKTIGLFRGGGYGDLLFLTPTAEACKRRWPKCKVVVACDPDYAGAIQHNPFIDSIIEMPTPMSVAEKFDAIVFFENVIENNPEAHTIPAVDCYLRRAGFSSWGAQASIPLISYVITDEEKEYANTFIKMMKATGRLSNTGPIVAVQARASSMVRTYPYTFNLIKLLAASGYNVLVFGDPSATTLKNSIEGVISLPDLPKPPSFRQSCAIMAKCFALVAPDSSLPHVAGALGMKAIALHGSFPGHVRHCYSKNTAIIEGKGSCGPCFHHQRDTEFPRGAPCEMAKFCVLLGMIRPETILKQLESWKS